MIAVTAHAVVETNTGWRFELAVLIVHCFTKNTFDFYVNIVFGPMIITMFFAYVNKVSVASQLARGSVADVSGKRSLSQVHA